MEQLSDEQLQKYIEGKLSGKDLESVEKSLQSSRELFERYMDLKHALYFLKNSTKPPEDMKKRILGLLPARKNQINFIVSFIENQISISSADQEHLDYSGMRLDFGLRASKPGPISVTRVIEGKEVTFMLIPSEDDFLNISASIKGQESYRLVLKINGDVVESIPDSKDREIFSTRIPKRSAVDVVCYRKDLELFCVAFDFKE